MKLSELKDLCEWKRINGRVYLVYETDEARHFLTADDLFKLIEILNLKNGVM